MRTLYSGLLIALALALVGCKGTKPLINEHSLNVKDSVSVVWKVIDTIKIARPGASVTVTVPLTESRDTTINQKVDHAMLTVTRKDSVLTINCTCDSLKVQIKQYQKEINRLRESTEKTIEPVIINELTPWQKFFYRLGLLAAVLLIGWGIIKFLNFKSII